MKAFLHHLAYDFRTGIRDRSKLLMYYLFPLVFFILVGTFMTSINPGFRQTMIPAMMVFAFMSSALLSLPGMLVSARETGVLRSLRINGVPSATVLTIPVISTAAHMAVISLIIAFAGARFFGAALPSNLPGFLAAALLSYLAYAGVGVLIGVAASNGTAQILLGQIFYIPSMLLGGLMVPSSMLPPALARVGLLLPATHAMQALTGLGFAGGSVNWTSVGVLAASAVFSFVLAALLFQWDSRATQPSRKAVAAALGIIPFALAAILGI